MKNLDNTTFIISASDAIDIINMIAYEDYAKLQRRLRRAGFTRRPMFEEFLNECKAYDMLGSFSIDMWRIGYEFIADLFDENERLNTPCDAEAKFHANVVQIFNFFDK